MNDILTEKSFDTGEIMLNYAENAASAAPLLMLHGTTRWWRDWKPLIPQLTPNWHIYACDLRGHGQSGRDADHYRLKDFTRDIVAFLGQKIGEPAVLAGHSLGALTAIDVAAQTPEHVRALVLLDPGLILCNNPIESLPGVKDWLQFVLGVLQAAHSRDDVANTLRSMLPDRDETKINQAAELFYDLAPELIEVMLRNQTFEGFDLEQTLRRITCPTLIIQADWDHGGVMRDEDADYLRSNLQGTTRIVKLSGASHNLLEDNSDTVLGEMEAFLSTVVQHEGHPRL